MDTIAFGTDGNSNPPNILIYLFLLRALFLFAFLNVLLQFRFSLLSFCIFDRLLPQLFTFERFVSWTCTIFEGWCCVIATIIIIWIIVGLAITAFCNLKQKEREQKVSTLKGWSAGTLNSQRRSRPAHELAFLAELRSIDNTNVRQTHSQLQRQLPSIVKRTQFGWPG